MRTISALVLLAALSACAEVTEGPRMVPYSADRFYVRSAPTTGDGEITELAQATCQKQGLVPKLQKSEQYYTVDVRDDTYDCVRP